MSTFINPFTDYGFKRIFGQEDHKGILIGFLNALFYGELVIADLVYRDKEMMAETKYDRGIIYDIYCTLSDGSHVMVEMQNKKEVNFDARALYYASRSIVAQGEKGKHWLYEYAPVIGVYFLNYLQNGLGHAFRTDFGITKTKVVFAHAASNVLAVDQRQTNEEPFSGRLRMVFLQMPEFTKTESECTTDLDKWAFIMNHLETLTHIPWAAQDELYAELSRISNVSALSPAERATYEENLRQYRDNLAAFTAAYQDGEKSGFDKGEKSGSDKKQIEIARRMIALQMMDDLIMQATGLSLAAIQKLREEA
ncbi:MAG: Rpn family recombination-promoting nuclease/putative transposase [Proteobacteria bacterium]|nr:Rpn family recombination-promoting nuclease/putative transposase [Pseudomonadota bacterium]